MPYEQEESVWKGIFHDFYMCTSAFEFVGRNLHSLFEIQISRGVHVVFTLFFVPIDLLVSLTHTETKEMGGLLGKVEYTTVSGPHQFFSSATSDEFDPWRWDPS